MKHRRLWHVVAGLEALMVLAAVYFEPSFQVRGTLWGEAFYDGKPTSWWRQELEYWEVRSFGLSYPPGQNNVDKEARLLLYTRESTWFEKQRERWRPTTPTRCTNLGLLLKGPKLVQGEADAEPVLQALQEDRSPKVRR